MTKFIPDLVDIRDAVGSVLGGRKIAVVFSRDLKNRTRAVRKFFGRGDRTKATDIVLTIGPPNYREREFLKLCKKAACRPKRLWFPGER